MEPTLFFIEKISFSLKLFSGRFYGQSFIKTVRGPLPRLDEFKHFADDLRISEAVNALENSTIHLPYLFHCCFRNTPYEFLILHMYEKNKDADQLHGDHA